MVSFTALCEYNKLIRRPTWSNLIFFKFFCLIVSDLLGLKPNKVISILGDITEGVWHLNIWICDSSSMIMSGTMDMWQKRNRIWSKPKSHSWSQKVLPGHSTIQPKWTSLRFHLLIYLHQLRFQYLMKNPTIWSRKNKSKPVKF